MKNYCLLTSLIASTVALSAANALADSAATIFADASGTAVTYDNASGAFPVISAILSQPGTVNGKTYTSWAFLAQDSTGSLDVFGALPGGSTYTPTVGDAISVSGTYSPYHQIPELGTLTSISLESAGHAAPSPSIQTVSSLNLTTLPQSIAGSLIQLDNITISSGSSTLTPGETWGTANLTLTMTDGSGSMTLYYWPTSYSAANANMFGETIPTGPVTIIGIDSAYTSGSTTTPEFIPISIQSVPEPTVLSLGGAGGLLALIFRLRRKV